MRHKIGYRKLNRTSEHRKALFKNMLNSLIKYEQIITTLPKAKELKPKIDKVITIGKTTDLSNKKDLFSLPLKLIHGDNDEAVSWKESLKIFKKSNNENSELIIIKNGDHRLSNKKQLKKILTIMQSLYQDCIS